ncbi:MAG: FtsX-like permease family protein [Sphingobacteriaceae bacterium]|nr:MAG: FtsX-like permease family protein [Sphingobacteriaceae bacterium]
MLKNYFKIAWRNLRRSKVYSLINIAGLSIGLACAMLILLYIKDEVSFDRFHQNGNQLYRIVSENSGPNGEKHKDSNTGLLQGPKFAANVPGIKAFLRVQSGNADIKTGTDVQSQELLYVDANFFTVFTFPLLGGDFKSCLKEPHSVVLSEDVAKKQFGSTDAVGKLIMLKEDSVFTPYKVTAVAKRSPQNSSIRFEMLLPFKENTADIKNNESWFNFFLNTFVVLDKNVSVKTVEKQMQNFYVRDAGSTFQALMKKYGAHGNMGAYLLQPYMDIHLSTELPAQNGLSNGSNPVYGYILSGIACFVLLIACINFINLTVAQSIKRAKEIGIRKVIGSGRKQLIIQFLSESFLLAIIAFGVALLLVQILLPVFNNLANKQLLLSFLFDWKLTTGYIGLFLLTGLLSGFYPAIVLSGYKPVETLYSRFNISGKNYLQKALVVLQFTLASFLIIATFILFSQFDFLTKTDLGYDDSNIVVVSKSGLSHAEAALFKNELLKANTILDVAPKNGGTWQTNAKISTDSILHFAYETVDESFLSALKIPLLQGRNFSKKYPADSVNAVLVNEAFVKLAGWKNPVGETVNFWYKNNETYQVVGVIKDYHFAPLNQKIMPQLFTMKNSNFYGDLYIKIKPNTATASLNQIRKMFKNLFPLSPYSYRFKNDENLKNYETEARWKKIILFGAALTIFISCIGLFGLSVLSAEKRTKEIGIRKVLGASVQSIVTVLSLNFVKLVAVALLISFPISWLAANKWLENYPYRIQLNWWLFTSAGFLVILIALATISFQAIKAALANPVKSLRSE